jgi:hypothetical protein
MRLIFRLSLRLVAQAIVPALACVLAAMPASLADPAVDGVNGKLTALGGAIAAGGDEGGVGGLAGSLTLPTAHAFGAQIDGAWARVAEEDFANAGLHLFWRNPNVGLLGVYGGYAHLTDQGGQDLGRAGLEAQYFAGRLTLDTAAGILWGDLDEQAYGRARLDYYPLDDLKLSAGFAYEDRGFGTVAVEYQLAATPQTGASIFADTSINDADHYAVMGGVKVYFGEQRSLIDRHRRQDPDGYAGQDLGSTQQAAANAARITAANASGSGGASGTQCPFTPYRDACSLYTQCATYGGLGNHPPPLTFDQQKACGCLAVDVRDCF